MSGFPPVRGVRATAQGSFPGELDVRAAGLLGQMMAMEQRHILHIVGGESRSRAEQARTAFALGHHAEIYSDLIELFERPPAEGIILLHQRALVAPFGNLLELLGERGAWVPVIVCDEEPNVEQVVAAIKGGALDYMTLPLDPGRLARSLSRVLEEADAHGLARRRLAEARRRVLALSKREREVLELLAIGGSNKLIARDLGISPRTVEIHRSNMMTKLAAGHSSEAVRIWLESELEPTVSPSDERWLEEGREGGAKPDFVRLIRERMGQVGEDTLGNDVTAPERPATRRARSR